MMNHNSKTLIIVGAGQKVHEYYCNGFSNGVMNKKLTIIPNIISY